MNFISYRLLFPFVLASTILCSLAHGYVPNDPTGYKIALKIISSVDSDGNVDNEEETHTFHFISNTTGLERGEENGQWYPEAIAWTRKSSTVAGLLIGGTVDITLNFQNSTTGTFTFVHPGSTGSGSFTLNVYQDQDLPFGHYFNDSFDDYSVSTTLWPIRSHSGITTTVKDGKFLISGTYYDLDDRWQDINANSILSLKEDWVVEGTAFNKLSEQQGKGGALVGVDAELEEGGFSFDISIGKQGTDTILAKIYVESFNSFSDQYTSMWTDSLANEEDFRLFNTSSSSTIYAQYFANGKWNTLSQLNWKTGVVTEKNTYTGDESTHEFTNWLNPDLSIVAPFMDFVMPSYYDDETSSDKILPLAEGDLGFSSFSVTEGAPEPDPEYAPSTLVGKIYQGTMNDVYQFIDETNAIFYHQESNFQNSEVSNITYTWSASGNSGTLTTSLDETTTLSFTSETEGTFQWQENGGPSNTGSFTLADASAGNSPDSLTGDSIIAGSTTYVFKDNGAVTIKSANGSEESTYGYVKSGDNEGVLTIPAYDEGEYRTVLKLTYSSTATGTLSEGGSGSFNYYSEGQDMPASKGWMWFDHYPWVYSHVEGGWLYFHASGSKLMVYSVVDETWREME
ncbi:MAG: hypothetical protein VW576_07645 [Opitutae bacterium]